MSNPDQYDCPRGRVQARAVFRALLDEIPGDGWLRTSDLTAVGQYTQHSGVIALMRRWAERGWLERQHSAEGVRGELEWRLTTRGRWEARKWLDRAGITTWQDWERERTRRPRGAWPTGGMEW